MKIEVSWDKNSCLNKVKITKYDAIVKSNDKDIVPTRSWEMSVDDIMLAKMEAMTDDELKTFINKQSAKLTVRVIGSAPELDNDGVISSIDKASFVADI